MRDSRSTLSEGSLLCVVFLLVCAGCKSSSSEKSKKEAENASVPSAAALPSSVVTDAGDFNLGFCEVKVGDASPERTGGGVGRLTSRYWINEEQRAGDEKYAPVLRINCGLERRISLAAAMGTNEADLPMRPGKLGIRTAIGAPRGSIVMANLPHAPVDPEGEMELEEWSASRVRGKFRFSMGTGAAAQLVSGTFDLACPFPGNGRCQPDAVKKL